MNPDQEAKGKAAAASFLRLYQECTTDRHSVESNDSLSPEEIEALGGKTFKNVRDFGVYQMG